MRLVDLDQDERLRTLRSERLAASVANMFKTKPHPYPSQAARAAWRRQSGTDFPISPENWPAAERTRIDAAKRNQKEEEANYQRAYRQVEIEVLSQYVSSLPKEFADHILLRKRYQMMSDREIDRGVDRYKWYRFHHDFMRALVEAAQKRERGKALPFASALPSGVSIGPKGRFRVKLAPIVEALNGVEVDRIRVCANKNCHRIFWAGRIVKPGSAKNDQLCCSPSCSHAMRNQRLRARYADQSDDYVAPKLTANEKWSKKKAHKKGK